MFVNQNYDFNGEIIGDLRFFYEYLIKYKELAPKILELLNKLKELDFTKERYGAYLSLSDNFSLIWVDNPQVLQIIQVI